jgi:hypothetical protein
MDGGDHPQTAYLMNWLINGFSGANIYKNRYLDEIFNDVMLLISPNNSYVFLTP